MPPQVVYVVAVDAAGRILARRYIHEERVEEWLTGMDMDRYEVYDRAPANGGSLVRIVHRR